MLRNFVKLAIRNISKNSLFSAIHILGLSIGISTCLIVFLILKHELNFDTFHRDGDRIYRMYSEFSGIFSGFNRGVAEAVPPYVKENFNGIESSVHFHTYTASVKSMDGQGEPVRFERNWNIIITGSDYFNVFNDYEWLVGDPQTALDRPFQVVITASTAEKYFGKASDYSEYIGRELIYNDSLLLNLAGIIKDLDANTDLVFTDFISFPTLEQSWLKNNFQLDDWGSTNSHTQFFIKLEKGTNKADIEAQIPNIHKTSEERNPNNDYRATFKLQPLSDLHFNKDLGIFDNSRAVANKPTLKGLIIVAILILLIASVNFINLSTAQATKRAKEIGLRKIMGGSRGMLIFQYLSESILICFIAVLVSLPLSEMALTYFNEFIPKGVTLYVFEINTFIFLTLLTFVVGTLAGFYPAMVISSFQPVKALKEKIYGTDHNNLSVYLRKGLTVFQFSFAQILIACAIIISLQISYMMKKDLGFEKDAIVYFYTPWWENLSKRDAMVNGLQQIAEVQTISVHQSPPAVQGTNTSTVIYKGENGEVKHNVHRRTGDVHFIPLYNIQLLAGRNFNPVDSIKEVIINETYMKQLGFQSADEVVGELVYMGGDQPWNIVAVARNFHFQSLHHEIQPLAIFNGKNGACVGVKLSSSGMHGFNPENALVKITAVWNGIYPDQPLNYQFMDESVLRFYNAEKRMAKLITTATIIAIIISCLGLFGLASFTTVQRTKEIGVRKVLGANIKSIILLVSRDFLKLVFIAFCVATPFAYWLSTIWIHDFAYRMDISVWVFIFTGFLSILIAFLTISYHAVKSALNNPVISLRYE